MFILFNVDTLEIFRMSILLNQFFRFKSLLDIPDAGNTNIFRLTFGKWT